MTKYREILRLKSLNLSQQNIADSCNVSKKTVNRVLKRAAELGISWPLEENDTDAVLAEKFFPSAKQVTSHKRIYYLRYIISLFLLLPFRSSHCQSRRYCQWVLPHRHFNYSFLVVIRNKFSSLTSSLQSYSVKVFRFNRSRCVNSSKCFCNSGNICIGAFFRLE